MGLFRLLSLIAAALVPLAGATLGFVLLESELATGVASHGFPKGLAVSSDEVLFALAVVLASLLTLFFAHETAIPRLVSVSRRPARTFRWHGGLQRAIAIVVALASLYALILDILGLLHGNPFDDTKALALKLVVLTLAGFGVTRITVHFAALPVHLLNGSVIDGRDRHYELQIALLGSLAPRGHIIVTSFEKYTQDYIEESKSCTKWMTEWQKRVENADIHVQQLLRIYNEPLLAKNAEHRIDRFKNHRMYEIRVLLCPAELPVLDCYLEPGSYAVLTLPKDTAKPFAMEQYLYLSGPEELTAIEKWFLSMWHHGVVLRDRASGEESLEAGRARLRELAKADAALLENPSQVVADAAQRCPEAVRLLAEVVRLSALGPLPKPATDALCAASHAIKASSRTQATRALVDAIVLHGGSAQRSMDATAVLRPKDEFWLTNLPRILAMEKAAEQRHVKRRRLFMANNSTVFDNYANVLNELHDAGCEIRTRASAPAEQRDFVVFDSATLVFDNGQGTLATETEASPELGLLLSSFDTLWATARPWPKGKTK